MWRNFRKPNDLSQSYYSRDPSRVYLYWRLCKWRFLEEINSCNVSYTNLTIICAIEDCYNHIFHILIIKNDYIPGSVNSWDKIQNDFNDIVDSVVKDDKGLEYKTKSRNIIVCIIIPILAVVCYSCYHIYQGNTSHGQSKANHNLVGSSQQVCYCGNSSRLMLRSPEMKYYDNCWENSFLDYLLRPYLQII